jgi:hypothetical protein
MFTITHSRGEDHVWLGREGWRGQGRGRIGVGETAKPHGLPGLQTLLPPQAGTLSELHPEMLSSGLGHGQQEAAGGTRGPFTSRLQPGWEILRPRGIPGHSVSSRSGPTKACGWRDGAHGPVSLPQASCLLGSQDGGWAPEGKEDLLRSPPPHPRTWPAE